MENIAENIKVIRTQMAEAAAKTGRDPKAIQLCAATKMNDAAAVRQAIAAGVDCCGENRVQELTVKAGQDAYAGAPIHFIGHLQTNKVRQVVGKVALIQSVDRVPLLEAIQKEAARQGIHQQILLEVNIGSEDSKSGFTPQEVMEISGKFECYPNLSLQGLMAIPPISHFPGENCRYFLEMYNLFVDISRKKYDNVDMAHLSMGMSGDFADAIACGSTMVRIGTGIFGARNYDKI